MGNDLGRRELRARGIPVPLGGRAFEVVTVLSAVGQRVYRARLAMHGVGDKLADIVEPERGQNNLLDPCVNKRHQVMRPCFGTIAAVKF
jgi:hypothetical protein